MTRPKEKTLAELADYMASGQAGSAIGQEARAEFTYRQTKAAQEAAEAQVKAAVAAQENSRYMLYSVIALVITSLIQALIALFK